MASMAGAEPAPEVAGFANWDAAEMCADAWIGLANVIALITGLREEKIK